MNSFEQGWQKVAISVQKIFDYLTVQNQTNQIILTKKEYSESYTIIYNLCIQRIPRDFNKDCYDKYAELLRDYLNNHVKNSINNKNNILQELKLQWDKYQILLKFLNGFFSYLDRSYVVHNNQQTLQQVGDKQFRLQIIQQQEIPQKQNIIQQFVNELEKSRQNQICDLKLLNSIYFIIQKISLQDCQILIDLKNGILNQSQVTFQNFQTQWQANLNYSEYLKKVEQFLKEEERRLSQILQSDLINQILKLYYTNVILSYKTTLIEEGFDQMLENNEIENLERMYYLFDKLDDEFSLIKNKFRDFVKNKGKKIIEDKINQGKEDLNDQTFIKNLINFQDSIQNLIQNTLNKNKFFERSMQEAFEIYLNIKIKEKTIAEYLAVFTDRILKSQGMEKLSEDQLTYFIKHIVIMFNSLDDKDIFMNLYHNSFAERILTGKFNLESEMQVILQIKMRCGDITDKLEAMLDDYQQLNDLNNNYQQYLEQKQVEQQFQQQVIQIIKDKSAQQVSLANLQQIFVAQQQFSQFYQENNRFYNLQWVNLKSQAVINVKFNSGKHELTMNLLQASILYMFESKPQDYVLRYNEIQQRLNYDDEIVKKLLAPLCLGKIKILVKQDEQKVITDQDEFRFNYDLKCNSKKINIPFVQIEQTLKKDKIQDNRELAIEAAIVRIMKTRKMMKYQDILQEVNNSLQMFQPDVKITKKKIEQLIEKDYLERHKDDMSLIKYIA